MRGLCWFKVRMDILLIHPPVVKPSEPPAGLARLSGALRAHGVKHLAIDANIEGIMHLLGRPVPADDTWTRRASSHLGDNIASLRSGRAFTGIDRYTRAVTEINRVLARQSSPAEDLVSLGNFTSPSRSPVRSSDLLEAADRPEESIFYGYFTSRIAPLLEEHAPRVVGLSLNYLSQALTAFALAGFIRSLSSGVRIVLGGGLVTSWGRGIGIDNPFGGLVDELHAGPGEGRLLELAGRRCTGMSCLPDFGPFGSAYLSPRQVIPLAASDGCYWARCSFCPEKAEGSRYHALEPKQAVEGIGLLEQSVHKPLVHVCDNAMSPAFLKAMAARESRTPWYGFARVTPLLADPDFCVSLRRSGCVMLKLGIESGDQDVLDALGKGIRVEDSLRVLQSVKAAGIGTYVYLLFGTPAEDRSGAEKTFDFIAKNHGLIDFLNLSIFNLPRGSAEALALQTYDFSEGDLSLYQGFVHPRGWDRKQVRRFLDRELKRHPAVAAIVRADPPSFTSNHAPFFLDKTLF
ncbi:MAG TPA: B12-binding domain-containing radical SAM protein [Deltaproteobacteria bacterium]|nr:B12-binding domain-containing radical SAM protein [Deltaproteobacteria bacterium]